MFYIVKAQDFEGGRIQEKKGPAHLQRSVLPRTRFALSLASASANVTNQAILSAAERERRFVRRKEEVGELE